MLIQQSALLNLTHRCGYEQAKPKPDPPMHGRVLGRPHFEVCVVKRVVKSFATGVDDVFKPVIEQMLNDKNKRNASNRRRELLT